MIQVQELSKKYPGSTAVDHLNFNIERGEIVGFLGPNGAGKTTTMRMLTAFIRPSGGRATVAGFDVETHPLEVRKRVGYLPENVPLYGEMRVTEFLRFRASLKGVERRAMNSRIDEVVGRCGLGDVRNRIIEQLSKGYRQRVGLAEALVHDPPILILDEPTVGLDPNQIRQVRSLIVELGRQHTLILSSHILPEVEQVCARILIINRGKIVAQDRPEDLRRSLEGGATIQVEIRSRSETPLSEQEVASGLGMLAGVSSAELEPGDGGSIRARLSLEKGRDLREEVFRLAVDRSWVLLELSQKRMSLEDIFLNVTTRDDLEQSAAAAAPDAILAPPDSGGTDDSAPATEREE